MRCNTLLSKQILVLLWILIYVIFKIFSLVDFGQYCTLIFLFCDIFTRKAHLLFIRSNF